MLPPMAEHDDHVDCEIHGLRRTRRVCFHVAEGIGCGVHLSDVSPRECAPDAWCDKCEAKRAEIGGWTETIAKSASVEECCEVCFAECVRRNQGPAEVLALGTSGDIDGYYEYAEKCAVIANAAKEKAEQDYGISTYPKCDYSPDAHTLTFSGKDGPKLVWDAAVAGTYEIEAETWMWVWGPEEPLFPVRPEIERIRVLGNVRKLPRLCFFHVIQMTEAECWELTAVAMVLTGGACTHRAPMDNLHVYMVLSNPRLEP